MQLDDGGELSSVQMSHCVALLVGGPGHVARVFVGRRIAVCALIYCIAGIESVQLLVQNLDFGSTKS